MIKVTVSGDLRLTSPPPSLMDAHFNTRAQSCRDWRGS